MQQAGCAFRTTCSLAGSVICMPPATPTSPWGGGPSTVHDVVKLCDRTFSRFRVLPSSWLNSSG